MLAAFDSDEPLWLGADDSCCASVLTSCAGAPEAAFIGTVYFLDLTIESNSELSSVQQVLAFLLRLAGLVSLSELEAGGLGRQATANCSEASKSSNSHSLLKLSLKVKLRSESVRCLFAPKN